jgi:carbonic anhydrase
MTTKERILLESKAWTQEKLCLDKDYFNRLDGMHNPNILWLSSADSLVPVRELTNSEPGDILVYRNIATQVREDDLSLMAVIQDAIETSHITHIVVCGYSHCSGVRDVLLGTDDRPAVKEWLKNLRALYERHYEELEPLSFEQKEKRLSELNIREQVINLGKLPYIQRAWEKTDYPKIFGWYFDLLTGSLLEVYSMEQNHKLKQVGTLMETVS